MLIAVGIVGIVVPVLPGTITIGISLLVWAIALQNTVGWVVFAIGMVFVAAGMLASLVLTGRRLKQRQVPNWSIMVAVLTGVVGMFVIPVVGLFIGFAAGLLLSEYTRRRHFGQAVGPVGRRSRPWVSACWWSWAARSQPGPSGWLACWCSSSRSQSCLSRPVVR